MTATDSVSVVQPRISGGVAFGAVALTFVAVFLASGTPLVLIAAVIAIVAVRGAQRAATRP